MAIPSRTTQFGFFGTLGVLVIGGMLIALFLRAQDQATAANIVFGTAVGLAAVVLAWGAYAWREMLFSSGLLSLYLVKYAVILVVSVFIALVSGGPDLEVIIRTVVGTYAMATLFLLGLFLIRLVFRAGHPIIGIARTTVDEAVRMKAPLVIIVLLILLLPMLPLFIPQEDQLRYRIQTFLTWSMLITSLCLSLMTIFLAVGTVTSEIHKRQIFLTLTKPVGRAQYLAGKWIGIASLNAVLIVVSGLGIYAFATSLAAQKDVAARSGYDYLAVEEGVLAARQAVKPVPTGETGLAGLFNQRLERLRRDEPATYGQPGSPVAALPDDVRNSVQQQVLQLWYTVPPQNRTVYRFTGLVGIPEGVQSVQLRVKPKLTGSSPDGFARFALRVNDTPFPNELAPPGTDPFAFKFADNKHYTIPISTRAINERGEIDIEVFNFPPDQSSLSFNPKDGIELLYRVDSFEMNLVRSMAILWLRVALLAMIGIAASTFLGFPVACLATLLFYMAAAGHGYIAESISSYGAFPRAELPVLERIVGIPTTIIDQWAEGKYWDGFKVLIRMTGSGFIALIPSFAEYNPTPLLADGRLVSWSLLGRASLWIGLIWTGLMAVVGYLLFRAREIARVIV